jgi:hypothetical protein
LTLKLLNHTIKNFGYPFIDELIRKINIKYPKSSSMKG